MVIRAGAGRGGGLEGAAAACLNAGIPFVVVVRPHTLVSKRAVKVKRCSRNLFRARRPVGALVIAFKGFMRAPWTEACSYTRVGGKSRGARSPRKCLGLGSANGEVRF